MGPRARFNTGPFSDGKMDYMKRMATASLPLLVVSLVVCGRELPQTIDAHTEVLARGYFVNLSVGDGVVYATRDAAPLQALIKFEVVHIGSGGEVTPLPPDPEAECATNSYGAGAVLSDGRLVVTETCLSGVFAGRRHWVKIFDPVQDHYRMVLSSSLRFDPGPMAWNDSLTFGVGSVNSVICSELVVFQDGRQRRPDFRMRDSAGTWSFDPRSLEHDCPGRARTAYPQLTSTGLLAFLGSAPGDPGFDRLSDPWGIYLLRPGEDSAQAAIEDILDPAGFSLTADGDCLAFAGSWGGIDGTWIMNVPRDDARQVLNEPLLAVSWDGDDNLIGLRGTMGAEVEIVRVDASCP